MPTSQMSMLSFWSTKASKSNCASCVMWQVFESPDIWWMHSVVVWFSFFFLSFFAICLLERNEKVYYRLSDDKVLRWLRCKVQHMQVTYICPWPHLSSKLLCHKPNELSSYSGFVAQDYLEASPALADGLKSGSKSTGYVASTFSSISESTTTQSTAKKNKKQKTWHLSSSSSSFCTSSWPSSLVVVYWPRWPNEGSGRLHFRIYQPSLGT